LVAAHAGAAERIDAEFPGGAALVEGAVGWVLLDPEPVRSFGAALVWTARRGVDTVHIVAERDAEVLARRAGCFDPAPTVWSVDGTTLVPAVPEPVPSPIVAPSAPELAELLVDADLEVVVEDGIVRGEINGLEVARIVHGRTTAGEPIDRPLLEVGVGQADRELTGMLHGAMSPVDQLARVAEIVRSHRRPGARTHPLNQLVPERWLRARLIAAPERIGLDQLRAAQPTIPRANLRDRGIAVALGESGGSQVVVACSVGVDLDLVPAAADARLALAPDARLLLVVPARDAHPVTLELAARLRTPAEVVPIEDGWRQWGPSVA
jgi:hypothetical protein